MSHYLIQEKIDPDQFSSVYKAIDVSTNENICVKKVQFIGQNEDQELLLAEIQSLQAARHENIVECYDSYQDGDFLCVVMEYVEGKNLKTFIQSQATPLPESFILSVFGQIVSALSYMHSLQIIHRDLKPENILLTKGNKVKICGFLLEKIFASFPDQNSKRVGTYLYMAPEVISEHNYSFASDVWSLGCIIYELMHYKPPFENPVLLQLFNSILNKNVELYQEGYSNNLREIVAKTLEKNPNDRATLNEIKKSFHDSSHFTASNDTNEFQIGNEDDTFEQNFEKSGNANVDENTVPSDSQDTGHLEPIEGESSIKELTYEPSPLVPIAGKNNYQIKMEESTTHELTTGEITSTTGKITSTTNSTKQYLTVPSFYISSIFHQSTKQFKPKKTYQLDLSQSQNSYNNFIMPQMQVARVQKRKYHSQFSDEDERRMYYYEHLIIVSENTDLSQIHIDDSTFLLILQKNVTKLPMYLFYQMKNWKSVDIRIPLRSLPNYCFFGCSNLQTIKLPSSLTRLGYCCFTGCPHLESKFLRSFRKGMFCFANCPILKIKNK